MCSNGRQKLTAGQNRGSVRLFYHLIDQCGISVTIIGLKCSLQSKGSLDGHRILLEKTMVVGAMRYDWNEENAKVLMVSS